MSEIQTFRVNGYDLDSEGVEFYFKVQDNAGQVLCNLGVTNDGLHYFKAASKILSQGETSTPKESTDFMLPMEKMNELFSGLKRIKKDGDGSKLKITSAYKKVILEFEGESESEGEERQEWEDVIDDDEA